MGAGVGGTGGLTGSAVFRGEASCGVPYGACGLLGCLCGGVFGSGIVLVGVGASGAAFALSVGMGLGTALALSLGTAGALLPASAVARGGGLAAAPASIVSSGECLGGIRETTAHMANGASASTATPGKKYRGSGRRCSERAGTARGVGT